MHQFRFSMWLPGLCLALIALGAVGLSGCDQEKPAQPVKVPDEKKVWSPEEVAADPEGYMNWADARIGKQIEDRTERIESLNMRLAEIDGRHRKMRENIADMHNIRNRLDMAIRRAEDEDRWPVQMGGRSYEKAQALQMMEESKKYIEDRAPLAEKYDQAVARVRNMTNVLSKEISDLKRLREKMALDMEAVRLTQGLEDLEKLRRTEAEITGFAQALGSMADDSMMENLPDEKGTVDLDSLLKKQ